MTGAFSFHADWVVAAPVDEVQGVLVDLEHYPEWWPQVRAVAKIDDDHARVLCRARLPYTLDLVLTAVRREPRLLETGIEGDLIGVARWRLTEADGGTRLEYAQDVVLARRPLRVTAGLLRPVMEWNHRAMMSGCLVGLRRRLENG